MKKVVISLGGSVIVPDRVDYTYLKKFSKVIKEFTRKNKVIIVTGGGNTARRYIQSLVKLKTGDRSYALIGIAATRLNARLIRGIFNLPGKVPETLKKVKEKAKKYKIVICGALGAGKEMTSDANAVQIAKTIKADYFVNITDIDGLYNKNPLTNKNAKFIPKISFRDFLKIADRIKYKAGQNFILDQVAAKLIKKHNIKTYIIGKDLRNLKKLLNDKEFYGTIIS